VRRCDTRGGCVIPFRGCWLRETKKMDVSPQGGYWGVTFIVERRRRRRMDVVCTTLTAICTIVHFATWRQCVCTAYKAMFTYPHKGDTMGFLLISLWKETKQGRRIPQKRYATGFTFISLWKETNQRTIQGTLSLENPWDAGESQTSELHSGNATHGGKSFLQTNRIYCAVVCIRAEKETSAELFGLAYGKFIWCVVCVCFIFARGIEPLAYSVCLYCTIPCAPWGIFKGCPLKSFFGSFLWIQK